MKYHILHVFRTSAAFEEKSSDYFEDKLKLLTNFDINNDIISRRSSKLCVTGNLITILRVKRDFFSRIISSTSV